MIGFRSSRLLKNPLERSSHELPRMASTGIASTRAGRNKTPSSRHSFYRSLRDELLNKEVFETLDKARVKPALWRYEYNNIRPHSSLGNKTPAEARRALYLNPGSAPKALEQPPNKDYQPHRLSL